MMYPPGIYSKKIFSEAVYTMRDYERTLQIKNDGVSVITKLVLTCFGEILGTLRFDEISFFLYFVGLHTMFGFVKL